jgi:thymidylate kinase
VIVVLEGIDGSGKTTAAQLLCRKLEGQFPAVEYWSKSSAEFEEPFVRRHALSLRGLIWPPAGDKPARDMLGTHYYMFLIAAWFSVVERHRLRRIREADTLAVFDGWFYRNIAKAFVREKLDKDWMRTLFDEVGTPDLVVLLDVEPAVAWGRRPQYTLDEVGRWDGFGGDAFDSFCAYQHLVRGELLELAGEYGWDVVRQTADTSIEEVVAEISDRVLSRAGRRAATPEVT